MPIMGTMGGNHMNWKKGVVVSGLFMGCIGAFIGMLPSERPAEAMVLVHDEENIAEAIKTAINTASMLTNEQKQLALQILDMSSMSESKLTAYIEKQTAQGTQILTENGGKIGALKPTSSSTEFWNENFTNLESVLNGTMSVSDARNAAQKSLKALESTNQDALHNAKTTQTASNTLADSVTTAVTNSANASGTKEAVQANTQVVAASAMGTAYGNNLLSELLATQVTKYQKENQDEAIGMSINQQTADKLQVAVNNQVDHSKDSNATVAAAMFGSRAANYE